MRLIIVALLCVFLINAFQLSGGVRMIDALDIGYTIKDRRAQIGMTQAQLAEAAGVSKRCLWSMELGCNSGMQFDKLTAVLEVLGLDLAIVETDGSNNVEVRAAPASPDEKNGKSGDLDQDSSYDALAILTGGTK